MTTSARLTVFHLLHRYMRIGIVSLEQFRVAIVAAEEARMEFVAEYYRTEVGNTDWNLFCQMAKTALGKAEGTRLIVTLTTRLPLLHFSHGYSRVFITDFI
jgi:hypothetical protein